MKKYFAITLLLLSATAHAQDGKLKVVRDTTQSITNTDQVLNDVDVVVRIEKTKMNGDVMVTRIVGSPLSNAGTANDALARVPGLMRRNGSIEVIGKGTPIYYINGRKVNDVSELSRLSSQEIKEVEVINTPGAQFDAQVNAVIRIKTVKRSGEGIGGSIDLSDYYGLRDGDNRDFSTVNLNLRHKSIEVFGGATFDDYKLVSYKTDFNQISISKNAIEQKGKTNMAQRYNNLKYSLGFDWQISDNQSIGIKVDRNNNLRGKTDYQMNSSIYSIDQSNNSTTLVDQLTTNTHTDAHGVDSWAANTYYLGQFGKMEMNWNFDYYHTHETTHALSDEVALSGSRQVDAKGSATNDLFASKLLFSYPISNGKLQAGGEVDVAKRKNDYCIDQSQINNDNTNVRENTYALFAEYGGMTPVGVLNLGIRYERVDFRYKSLFDANQNISRSLDHLYPNFSFATQLKEIQASVSYAVKIRRPNFRDLRSNIEYNNRYTLSTGNPQLKNEINQQAAINARWRFLTMSVNYQCQKDGIYDWTYPYDDNGTILFSWVNFNKPIHSFGTFVNITNTFGKYTPSYTACVQKQWLAFDLSDPRKSTGIRTVKYNKPMFIFNANNAWRIPSRNEDGFGAWQLELNSEFMSGFHWGNAEITNCYWNLSCAIQKSWLENDALSLRLVVNDIFQTAHHNARLDFGNYIMTQTHINGVERSVYDPQTLSLSLRYKFNASKNKYRGTGAGNDIKSRM